MAEAGTAATGEDAVAVLCRHALHTPFEALPAAALDAAKVFLLDSLGVAMAGSRGPFVAELIEAARGGGEARVLGRRERLPAGGAALVNAYQVHNSEFDCIHEAAVVHPMAVLPGALLAWIDRAGGAGRPVTGRELLAAVVLGVDVAACVGLASRAPMRFFRPATAGAFAATAALGRLAGFDAERLGQAMGLTYAQLCGTMQAHVEGSPALAMQAGFNARNAVLACDLAARGVPGPRQVLQGAFGYLALFEGDDATARVLPELGRRWRITEVAHKPFPSGRATHGIVDACLQLRRDGGFAGDAVASVTAAVPPLTHRLVGRPPVAGMNVNYARLCGAWAAARALSGGALGLGDYTPEALADPASLAFASRVQVVVDDNRDPNALAPVTVTIRLHDGRVHERRVDVVYGNPARPMSREAHLRKFLDNCAAAVCPADEAVARAVVAAVDGLETRDDVRHLIDPLAGAA
jgi:2-methylcitrate dehydratase PrpD